MDHALTTRAPQTGSPPSPDWSLHQSSSSETASSFAFYSVLDAVGVRLGTISGWVHMPGGQVAGLCVALSGLTSQPYLIPLGYVTGVDPRHRTVHLRELTRRGVPRVGVPCEVIPPREVLEAMMREAPAPRAEILTLFRHPEQGPTFSQSTPVVVPVRRAEGGRPAPPRTPAPALPERRWQRLEQMARPAWRPLQSLGAVEESGDESAPRWL